MTTNQTERVSDEELDQMIWKLERDGMTPKMLSLMRELREVRRAKGEPVAWMYEGEDGREYNGHNEFSGGGKGVPLYAATPAAVVPTNVADAIERLKQRLADCHRFNYCAEAVREVEDACRAAMLQGAEPVSEHDELPLDYLQGLKDGLEWAAQMAEANNPQTGDWLYDDPIELARAIRKGPDMPTVQDGNSPVTPDCWCRICRPVTMSDMRFVVCPECGNKRCPHANDHNNACTGSNEPGQVGSAYPAAPQQEVKSSLEHGMQRYA